MWLGLPGKRVYYLNVISSIKGFETFVKVEPVSKGMSSDKKYYVETVDRRHLLLRMTDISEYYRKKSEFKMMKQVFALDVPMPEPLDFGLCNDGKSVYTLLTWVDGDEVEAVLPTLSETKQYILGIKSGEILRKIHSIPASSDADSWAERYFSVIDERLDAFRTEGVPFNGDTIILEYLEANRHMLKDLPQCRHHGDYHEGNMILTKDGKLFVIDWHYVDFDNYGDPWYEFNRVGCTYPAFASGQINGYFNGKPPEKFWRLLAYYLAASAITSIVWAKYFAPERLNAILKLNEDILAWFDNMKNPVPSWYTEDLYIQYIDEIPYKLKKPFDMSFISRYGTVFKVFDDQDSGNICFGIQNDDGKYFIKFAGAPTERACCWPEHAIQNLKSALPAYRDLAHDNLIDLVSDEEIGGGYAAVFKWTDSECMGRMYPASQKKFMDMPIETKLRVYEDILLFHTHVHEKGYVAIDFYDGSIMYDFEKAQTIICDIDFYSKKPYINKMGRLWGSSRYMSPEEFMLGAEIDEITNVYTMGAVAFALFSEYDRSIEKWPLGKELYEVIKKAVSDERELRQRSIRQLIDEWNCSKTVNGF